MKVYEIELLFELDNAESINRIISIYQETGVSKQQRLTQREGNFLAQLVVIYHKGINLSSRDATKILEDKVPGITSSNRGAHIYRGKLLKKRWLSVENGEIQIPKLFRNKDNFDLKFKFINAKK